MSSDNYGEGGYGFDLDLLVIVVLIVESVFQFLGEVS